jgi:SAM-dependent methyltransferase
MQDPLKVLQAFVEYATKLREDENGEAQVFCEHLFQAFGHSDLQSCGAVLEHRVRRGATSTGFADLVWKPRVLIEMKKRGEPLGKHQQQLANYWWELVPNRPKYALLCNFDEFWIFDFNEQTDEPVDKIRLTDLVGRRDAFNFLLPKEKPPLFGNDKVEVTKNAANKLAEVFKSLRRRNVEPERAQRFLLQCLVALFSEDAGLLPSGLFMELLDECGKGASSYDLIGGLFRQMNSTERAKGGKFREVPYFDGGLFSEIRPVDLNTGDIWQLSQAAEENWASVQPAIFGVLFQDSTEDKERHTMGAHYTCERDILKVVRPSIIEPLNRQLEEADSLKALLDLRKRLASLRVLDPACGSGNFLYVAYREMRRLETAILDRIFTEFRGKAGSSVATRSVISTRQFFGIDKLPFAVELAKVTLTLARELALKESRDHLVAMQEDLPGMEEPALPLENLDQNILAADALFDPWPKADVIVGNPPFQSKNKAQREFGRAYLNGVRSRYPLVPGRADYCVYWFHRAHNELRPGGRAGLVGTNTIRQNYSRQGALDYIVANGGTIIEAVSTQVWSGDAAVHVSIVNWVKGEFNGQRTLHTQIGDKVDSPEITAHPKLINSALSFRADLSSAERLDANRQAGVCYQGQTHGHEGFLLDRSEAERLIAAKPKLREALFPYLIGEELLAQPASEPARYVIDFHPRDVLEAARYEPVFGRVKSVVLPDRQKAAKKEGARNKEAQQAHAGARVNHHHQNFLRKWWMLSYPRTEMMRALRPLLRYAVCVRVTKRPVFEFVFSGIHPNDALMVFALEDDYSFGVLQSSHHWEWFKATCSTLEERFRYTSDTVFDTFPWPQIPSLKQVQAVVTAAAALRKLRRAVMERNHWCLRDLYRSLDQPGVNPLRDAHDHLDKAVREAYGMDSSEDVLEFLLALNAECAKSESKGKPIVGPGLPAVAAGRIEFITKDCVQLS